ncbi:MAG: GNAT family N-acetyltransferase [Thermodesulfobacteriota bacterium]
MEEVELSGYYPGLIGQITQLHAVYYAQHWGLDLSFEAQVSRELSEFMAGFQPQRDFLRAARQGERLAGAVALDGSQTEGARLRWFIVDPAWQGTGLGQRLLSEALAYGRAAGHRRLFLWTFAGLDAARRLYEAAGFRLAEEHPMQQWGQAIVEQKFVLDV